MYDDCCLLECYTMQSAEASRLIGEFCILHYQGTISSVDGATSQTTANFTASDGKTTNTLTFQYLVNCLNLLLVVTSVFFFMNDYCGCICSYALQYCGKGKVKFKIYISLISTFVISTRH
jgi:hypothetical protein